MAGNKITTVWSDLDSRIVQDAQGGIKKAENVAAVLSAINNILKTSPGERCLTGDTLISLINGKEITLKELSKSKEEFWVYSINLNNNMIEPAKARAFYTGKKKTIQITLDNGKKIDCTPDHKFMLRNGHYQEARYLKSGDSLMPLYLSEMPGKISGTYPSWDNIQKTEILKNHKVLSVLHNFEEKEVYDLAVEKNHNFALAAGIFVHNCMRPTFGCGLRDLLFENMDDSVIKLVAREIQEKVEIWDNRVQVVDITIDSNPDNSSVSVQINFAIKGQPQIFQYVTEIKGEI